MSEDRWLGEALAGLPAYEGVRLGPGDDGAVLKGSGKDVVVATDVLVDGVHFRLASCGPALAARKAVAVNLSDLAAMGARPTGMVVGAVLPGPAKKSLFDALMRGFRDAAAHWNCPLLGGDTNVASGPLVLAVTVLGEPSAAGPVTRAGAKPGDSIAVTGALGGSMGGRHLTFEPRLAEGWALAADGVATAMMDLSDGLSRDLPRLCQASGVGATLDAASIPIHADAEGELERALHDGEDFELLVAYRDPERAHEIGRTGGGFQLIPIGTIDAEPGVRLVQDGRVGPLEARGWDHLAG